jgi:uncharacterized protein with HEPN domain
MKNTLTDKDRLYHILDAITNIENFSTGINYQNYIEDYKLRLALVKLLEIVGEASNGITLETQERFPEVEWAVLKGIRNILVHEYFGIDYDIVWESITQNIPVLKDKIEKIFNEL